ncbi:alpha/beta hydrolase [Planctobacterium marinum]|uniref:alpha/beta hydrolase n=1 Tax=Planctobacterium marinum TaxID=1631968 RepID=UPI001E317EC0|nr:alpha/beta fold hydrolase [Planctobacterium marinum]MCC2606727.1 alpha/beta fold hydrolase [Planctobacterium marinum]
MRLKVILFLSILLLTLGCSTTHHRAPLHLSGQYYNYLQPDFASYLQATETYLTGARDFLTDDHVLELSMNMPFERTPEQPAEKAILLVHGLSDSPFSFVDISRSLEKQGFYVQTLLLPGHGTRPADMKLARYEDWQKIVDHYAALLKQDYQEVWLGGYSTGGNLVTIHALQQPDIAGLLLFSPGFESKAVRLEPLTPLLASVLPVTWQSDDINLARYSGGPLHGAAAYAKSAEIVRNLLQQKPVNIPTFVTISEADSVINAQAIKDLFSRSFTHSASELLWFGEQQFAENNIRSKSMQLPLFNISSGSHMSLLFAPCNHYYGLSGSKRMCNNGLNSKEKAICESDNDVWFAAWGHEHEDRIHARLTWNPYFGTMMERIQTVQNWTQLTNQQLVSKE